MNTSRLSINFGVMVLVFGTLALVAACAQRDAAQQLKPLIDTYVRAWNTGDFNGLENVAIPQFELHMGPQFDLVRGLDSLKIVINYWRTAYPDFHITVDELIYAGNAVTARWTIRATNTGPGKHPPTGKAIVVPGISILHVSGGKIIDEWIAEAR